MASYLVTGGAGFIGSHLADACIARGDEVCVLDDLSTGSVDNIRHLCEHANFRCVVDSLFNVPLLTELVDNCDLIYHLAAAVGVKLVDFTKTMTMEWQKSKEDKQGELFE